MLLATSDPEFELYRHQSANFCGDVDWPVGHTHHQYPSSQHPPVVTPTTTPHTNGPLYETGLAGPFVDGNSR